MDQHALYNIAKNVHLTKLQRANSHLFRKEGIHEKDLSPRKAATHSLLKAFHGRKRRREAQNNDLDYEENSLGQKAGEHGHHIVNIEAVF